jgi:hypothetical protein
VLAPTELLHDAIGTQSQLLGVAGEVARLQLALVAEQRVVDLQKLPGGRRL